MDNRKRLRRGGLWSIDGGDLDDEDADHSAIAHEQQVAKFLFEQQRDGVANGSADAPFTLSSDDEEGARSLPAGSASGEVEPKTFSEQLKDYTQMQATRFRGLASGAENAHSSEVGADGPTSAAPSAGRSNLSEAEQLHEYRSKQAVRHLSITSAAVEEDESDEEMREFHALSADALSRKGKRNANAPAAAQAVFAAGGSADAPAPAPAPAEAAVRESVGGFADAPAPAPAPAEAAVREAVLNAQQRAAVELSRSDSNILIVGGAGVGKSQTLIASIAASSKKVHMVMGPHHSSTSLIRNKCKKDLPPEVFANQRFGTVNKGTGVHMGENWDVDSIVGNFHNEGRAGLEDSISADRIIIDEVGQLDSKVLSTMRRTFEQLRSGKRIPTTLVGDLQTQPIKCGDSLEEDWFFECDAIDESFTVVALSQSYRVCDPRAVSALKDIKMRVDSPAVRMFFETGLNVDLSGHERETVHLFCSNHEAENYARKDLTNIYGASGVRVVSAAPPGANYSYAQKVSFGLKFVWELVLVAEEIYLFQGCEQQMVVVDDVPLRNKDKLRCTVVDDGSGKAEFQLLERDGDVRVKLAPVNRKAKFMGVELTAAAFCIKYSRYGPVFSRQGDEFEYVWLHAEKIKGKNVFYTGLTRCKGSPFDGRLKISGLYKAQKPPVMNADGFPDWRDSRVEGEEALQIKWEACPKMVVFQQIVFGDVPANVFEQAMASIPSSPRWQKVMSKLEKMTVVRA